MGVKYCKLTFGWVEQVYGDDGFVVSQQFVMMESAAVERKLISEDEENDMPLEEILSPEELKAIEGRERHCDLGMVQPAK